MATEREKGERVNVTLPKIALEKKRKTISIKKKEGKKKRAEEVSFHNFFCLSNRSVR
jgi:hypothetical protein